MVNAITLNVTPTLTLIPILILTLPRTKNPIITLTLTLESVVGDIITGAIVAGTNVGSPIWYIHIVFTKMCLYINTI